MDTITKKIDDVVVIEVAGNVDGRTAPKLRSVIEALLCSGVKLVIDMGRIGYMSSAGLRVLLATQRDVSLHEGKFALVSVPDPIHEILSMIGFTQLLSVYDTLADGMAALR